MKYALGWFVAHVFLKHATHRLAEFGTIGVPIEPRRLEISELSARRPHTAISTKNAMHCWSWNELHGSKKKETESPILCQGLYSRVGGADFREMPEVSKIKLSRVILSYQINIWSTCRLQTSTRIRNIHIPPLPQTKYFFHCRLVQKQWWLVLTSNETMSSTAWCSVGCFTSCRELAVCEGGS